MRHIMIILLFVCASYGVMAQETIHTLQVGDTFVSLTETYDTCREAIIYENDLALNGIYSKYYFLEAGTELIIPPKAACDYLPSELYITVGQGETTYQILAKYRYPRTWIQKSVGQADGRVKWEKVTLNDTLQQGDYLRFSSHYFLNTTQELYVIDQSTVFQQIEHTLQVGDTLDTLAEHYDTCREAIIWVNRLYVPREASIGYLQTEGDVLIIPPSNVCDSLPHGAYIFTLDESMTQTQIIQRYRQFPSYVTHEFYQTNGRRAGILTAGTQQVIPYIHHMFLAKLNLIVQPENVESTTHILQQGDSFHDLAYRYNTCEDAILYANPNLQRTSYNDPSYQVEVGTVIDVPPASKCDTLPNYPIIYIVQEGDTLWSIARQYRTWVSHIVNASKHSPSSSLFYNYELLENYNLIEPGLILTIPESSSQYRVRPYREYLLVYDDDDQIEHFPQRKLTLSEIARCYGVDPTHLMEVNGLETNPYNLFYGGSLIIPDAQHNCVLHYKDSFKVGRLACYTQPLEEIAGLLMDTTERQVSTNNSDNYCYHARDVYDMLFSGSSTPVVVYDRYIRSNYIEYGNSDVPRMSMDMISYCFRHDRDAVRDVTYEIYDASIVPPDDDIRVYALPPHITCNQDVFDDYYVYRVRAHDTLSNIAKAYSTHPQLIVWANNLENPDIISVGQYLLIPTPTFPHVLQLAGGFVGLVLAVIGLRRVLRRRTQKVKRKPKTAS